MRFIFLLVLISAVAAAPVKRDLLPFAPASEPTATTTRSPAPPGAVPAVGGGVRGVESALPAVGNTLPAVAGSLDKGLVGSLVGPQRRDLTDGDTVDEQATPSGGALSGLGGLIKNAAGNLQGGVLRDFFPEGYYATASLGWASRPSGRARARSDASSVDEAAAASSSSTDELRTDAFVRPTETYYPFETASVDWKRQYDAGNGGEYGAGAGYGGGAGNDEPYAESGRGSTGGYGNPYGGTGGYGNPYGGAGRGDSGEYSNPYGGAGRGDGGAGWEYSGGYNDNPHARREVPRDGPSAPYDADAGAAYNADTGAGYGYGSHVGYGAGANAGGYTYVKSSGSISGSYEGIMAGGGAMDGYGNAGMGAGAHGEAGMSGRLSPYGTAPASPAYDASSPAIPAEPTAAPPAVHVPIAYAPAAPNAAVPPHLVPGPMIAGEEPSYLADHGRDAYNIPEGPATDISLQPYFSTDAPQDTAYPGPTYTANVAGEVPIDNIPATDDYPAAAKPTEWSYPSADVTDSLPVDNAPATEAYPAEAKPSEGIYPSLNEGSDYGATDAPTPTFDPTLYTTAPAPHGLGMEPLGPGPAEDVKPTMEVEPTYAAQAAPTEAASVIYK
ncbi:hypothetical protein EV714DRAFT_276814 [Schizophyllum commune]